MCVCVFVCVCLWGEMTPAWVGGITTAGHSTGEGEREREREKGSGRESEGERAREKGREREREMEREGNERKVTHTAALLSSPAKNQTLQVKGQWFPFP